jgi:outer membrane autotransporter protein
MFALTLLRRSLLLASAVGALALSTMDSATAFEMNAISNGRTLVTFNSDTPGTITSSVSVTGLQAGESLVGIDYRPARRGTLVALGSSSRLYVVNRTTGEATAIGTAPFATPLNGGNFGTDFNPVPDAFRIGSDADQNLRINITTGAIAGVDTTLTYIQADTANFGRSPNIVGDAYTNNFARRPGGQPGVNIPGTTLYVIDSDSNTLATQGGINGAALPGNANGNPNGGLLNTVGGLGVDTNGNVGFDIGNNNVAYAILTDPMSNISSLYTVDLSSGRATLVGRIGNGGTFTGLAIAPTPFAKLAKNRNEIAIGQLIDRFTGTPNTELVTIYGALDSIPEAETASHLARLTGEIHSTAMNVSFEQTARINSMIQNRIGKGASGAWADAFVAGGDFDNNSGLGDYDYDGNGVAIGLDTSAAGLQFGGAFSYASSGLERSVSGRNGAKDDIDINSIGISAYGGLDNGALNAVVSLGFHFNEYESDRNANLGIGQFSGRNSVRYNGDQFSLAGRVGYRIDFGGAVFEPFAGLSYNTISRDDFTETGNALALSSGEERYRALHGEVGGKVVGNVIAGNGVKVNPFASVSVVHDFTNDTETTFRITNAGLGNFVVDGSNGGDTQARLGAGVNFGVSENTTFGVSYQGDFSGERKTHAGEVGVRLNF